MPSKINPNDEKKHSSVIPMLYIKEKMPSKINPNDEKKHSSVIPMLFQKMNT